MTTFKEDVETVPIAEFPLQFPRFQLETGTSWSSERPQGILKY